MGSERYVLLGLGGPRSAWFSSVSQWTSTGTLGAEFVKNVSVDELHTRLESDRAYSAVIVDGNVIGVDRDLLSAASDRRCLVIVVDGNNRRPWIDLGADVILRPEFERQELADALRKATPIHSPDRLVTSPLAMPQVEHSGILVAVTGTGGSGTSTVAIALTQALAAHTSSSVSFVLGCDDCRPVRALLADMSLTADHAVLHHAGEVFPALGDLVDLHRTRTPILDQVLGSTFLIAERNYRLLLGLRRPTDWTLLRRRALESCLDSLRSGFDVVIAEIDPTVEGESESGSLDIEERHLLSRTVLALADVVVVVGTAGLSSIHSLLRVSRDFLTFGTEPARLLPVLNRVPNQGRIRRDAVAAFTNLVVPSEPPMISPIVLPERRGIELAHRDGARLPELWANLLIGPLLARISVAGRNSNARPDNTEFEPVPVAVGSLTTWSAEDGW